jgi:hypothetical protein
MNAWIREIEISPAPLVIVAMSHKLSSKMADAVKDNTVVTDSLAKISDYLSVSQIPNAKTTYQEEVKKHEVKIITLGDAFMMCATPGANEEIFIAARCWCLMKKKDSPYRLKLSIKLKDGSMQHHLSPQHITCI